MALESWPKSEWSRKNGPGRTSARVSSASRLRGCRQGQGHGMVELPAASGTLELRIESAGATSPSTLCVSVPSTVWPNLGRPPRAPACSPGPAPALWATLDGLFGSPWVIKGIFGAFWMIGPIRTSLGGSYIVRVAVMCHQKFFSPGVLCCTIRNRLPPTVSYSQPCVIGLKTAESKPPLQVSDPIIEEGRRWEMTPAMRWGRREL